MKLSISSVDKIYKDNHQALNGINLELSNGIFGLLGANGAGKSTLMKCLTLEEKPTNGEILLDNRSINRLKYKRKLGYVPQHFGLLENLSGEEFLDYIAVAKGLKKNERKKIIPEILTSLNLTEVQKKQIKEYSGGMKQRVGIAQALLNDPKIVILDEPSVGLDPDERLNLKQLLFEKSRSAIVILSTHIISDLESIADYIAILHKGIIVAQGKTEDLIQSIYPYCWQIELEEDYQQFSNKYVIARSFFKGSKQKVEFFHKEKIRDAKPRIPNLEDVYIYYTNLGKENQENENDE